MNQAAYDERVHPTRGGADFTEIIEFYREGEPYPSIQVRKLNTPQTRATRRPWAVSCYGEFSGRGDQFATKREALAYARALVAQQ